jgi:hypothetical protein
MRLTAYLRKQMALAPMLAALVVLGIMYGGGRAQPAEAYGLSAVVLFPVMAWQAKILLDVEPDVQRGIAATAIGSRAREVAAGLVTAALVTLPTIVAGLVLPWLVGGVSMEKSPMSLPAALATGLWLHLIVVPPAIAVGALASRAVSRSAGTGLAVLSSGFVLAIVLGLRGSPVPWLVPPIMPASRYAVAGATSAQVAVVTAWALAWAAIVLFGYTRLRRTRP